MKRLIAFGSVGQLFNVKGVAEGSYLQVTRGGGDIGSGNLESNR